MAGGLRDSGRGGGPVRLDLTDRESELAGGGDAHRRCSLLCASALSGVPWELTPRTVRAFYGVAPGTVRGFQGVAPLD